MLSFSQLQVLHYAGMDALTIVRVLNFGMVGGVYVLLLDMRGRWRGWP